MAGYHLFSTGEVLSAANVNDYLMKQTTMIFASASARTTALSGVLREGMVSYRLDAHVFEVYNGTAWVASETNLTTKGDLAVYSTAPDRLGVGADGTTLVANSSASTGLSWQGSTPAGKNAVFNGGMDIWQRGTSISLAASTGYASGFSGDRWQSFTSANQACTVQRVATGDTTNLPNIQYALRFQRNSGQTGTSYLPIAQSFESINSIPYAGKQVTFSFYARAGANFSSASNALSFGIQTGTGTDQNYYGTYTGAAYPLSSTATLTTTWQRFTGTATLSSSLTELAIYFNYTPVGTAGAADYYEVTGVQLELGSVATPFARAGGNANLEAASSGSAGFDGVLVSTNSASNPSGSGSNGWAGYQVAGKNAVINGGMDIWQRGTSFALAASTNAYTADRWNLTVGANQASTVSRQSTNDTTNLPNIQYCTRVQRNSGQTGTTTMYFGNSFETVNSIPYAGKTITLSFYARAGANFSASGNSLYAYVISGTGTDQGLQSGYTGFAYPTSLAATLTTTWQKFTATGTVSATATELGLQFQFVPVGTAGANDYYEVTGVQIELGSAATTFSRAGGTLQGELSAAQRYYYRSTASSVFSYYPILGNASSTTNVGATVLLPVSLRTTPTSIDFSNLAVTDGVTNTAVSTITFDQANALAPTLAIGVASGLTQYRPYRVLSNNNASAYFGLNAEL